MPTSSFLEWLTCEACRNRRQKVYNRQQKQKEKEKAWKPRQSQLPVSKLSNREIDWCLQAWQKESGEYILLQDSKVRLLSVEDYYKEPE